MQNLIEFDPSLVRECIGSGIDGKTYSYNHNYILKITNRYYLREYQNEFIDFLSYIQKLNSPHLVKIVYINPQQNGSVYYIMERLNKLNYDEEYMVEDLDRVLYARSNKKVKFEDPRFQELERFLRTFKYKSDDFAYFNVMKNNANQIVVIDLEQFFYGGEQADLYRTRDRGSHYTFREDD